MFRRFVNQALRANSKSSHVRGFASTVSDVHSVLSTRRDLRQPPLVAKTPADALRPFLKSNSNVYIHMAASTPTPLLEACVELKDEVKNVTFYHMSLNGPAPFLDPNIPEGTFRSKALFVSGNVRPSIASGRSDYVPVFFSEIPALFRSGRIPLDLALVQVSPPDAHGYCSLGLSVDCSLAAVQSAKHVIAVVNPQVPRTHGDGMIHINTCDAIVHCDFPMHEVAPEPVTDVELKIGQHVAGLIPDGATLQMGIGNIPNAVLASLTNHVNLGIHTELFSDGVLPLVESGAVNNKFKKFYPNRLVATFLHGTKKLYDFVHDNPLVAMLDVQNVNNPVLIASNPKVHAINSAIEVDLTGQVVADSIGKHIFSGVGGQMDFMRGAALSEGGKPIIAIQSTTKKGDTKIVPTLKPGAGVVTTRAHVHYVVTEYGVAELYTKSVRERAIALANIAHPDHRDALFEEIRNRFGRIYHPSAEVPQN